LGWTGPGRTPGPFGCLSRADRGRTLGRVEVHVVELRPDGARDRARRRPQTVRRLARRSAETEGSICMRLATTSRSRIWTFGLALLVTLVPAIGFAAPVLQEHVTGGNLDLGWLNGFGVSNNLQPHTLAAGDPAFPNPSGDGTVGLAMTS